MIRLLTYLLLVAVAGAAEVVPAGRLFEWGTPPGGWPGRIGATNGLNDAIMADADSGWSLVLRNDGSLLAWGNSANGQTNTPAGNDYVWIDCGWQHGAAVTSAGNVVEWGDPIFGIAYTNWVAKRPPEVTNKTVIQVACGDAHTAALTSDGYVYTWGERANVTNKNGVYSNVTQIASGWYHVLGITTTSNVFAFGDANDHEGGDQYITPPAELTNGTYHSVFVAAGRFQSYAIDSLGGLHIWGSMLPYFTNTPPASVTNVAYVHGGRYHTIIARSNGTVFAWGDNTYGQTNVSAGLTNASLVYAGSFISGGIMAAAAAAPTNIFYVSTTGDDTDPGTLAEPFRTVQHGVDVAVDPGDMVVVLDGVYDEAVASKASGVATNRIKIKANTIHGARIKEFRAIHSFNTLDGFQLAYPSSLNNAHVRVETSAHHLWITNCFLGPGAYLISSNASFASNYVQITDGAFGAVGLTNGSYVFLGSARPAGLFYTNHDTAHIVLSNSANNTRLHLDGTMVPDSGTNYWAFIYAGGDNEGFNGVQIILGSGIEAASNGVIANCIFSNMYGASIRARMAHSWTIHNNTILNNPSAPGIVWNGRNSSIFSNLFVNNPNVLHYTPAEIAAQPPVLGSEWMDYLGGYIGGHNQDSATNNLFYRNWVQNVVNQLGLLQSSTNATNSVFIVQSNVFVGFAAHWSASRDGFHVANNTFYNGAYDPGGQVAMALGGTDHAQTGLVVTNNVFVAIGDHGNTNNEGSISLVGPATSPVIQSNFVAKPETMGFGGVLFGANSNWFLVNGADPVFRNARDPLGADGLPFTDDDGLKPLPFSLIASLGMGALSQRTITNERPIAHFKQTTVVLWQDLTGTNFDGAWVTNLNTTTRGRPIRPYTTPEALGHIPVTITFNASNSIGGLGTTTRSPNGMNYYVWDFGDGASAVTPRSTVTHTFCTTGTVTVSLTVTNLYGNTDTYTNQYRLLEKTNAGAIYHVALTGNDTNAGTAAAPWRTIAKSQTLAVAGDTVVVNAGAYNEQTDFTAVASAANPIRYVSLGAHTTYAQFRQPGYVWEGFTHDPTNTALQGSVLVYQAADDMVIRNCRFIGITNTQTFGVISFAAPSGSNIPIDGQLRGLIEGCFWQDCSGPQMQINGSNTVVFNNIVRDTKLEGDFVRLFGSHHRVYGNYVTNMAMSGGHPDFFQSFGSSGVWFKDVIIEDNVYVGTVGGTNALCQLEMNENGNDLYTNNTPGSWTNIIIRNNLFANLGLAGSVDMDGTKWYNNLFYRCNSLNLSHVFAMGGGKGSAWGTEWYNNAFVECGTTTAAGPGWYPQVGDAGVTNWSFTADYNYAGGTNGVAKDTFSENNGVNGGLPAFAGLSISDFRLLTNSVLLNAGSTISGFDDDSFGTSRPMGSAWDIGPLEGEGEAAAQGGEGDSSTRGPTLRGKMLIRGKVELR